MEKIRDYLHHKIDLACEEDLRLMYIITERMIK